MTFKLLSKAALALAAMGLCLSAASAAYKSEYKLSVVPGASSGWGQTATFFADCVRQKSNGRINIKPYFGAQLMAGKQTSELLLVRRGAIDFALASTINWSPQIKELNLTALPFFVANNPDHESTFSFHPGAVPTALMIIFHLFLFRYYIKD